MNKVNCSRVLLGGVVGGIVIFLLMGLANHIVMGDMWKAWMAAQPPEFMNHPAMHSLIFWAIQSFVIGLTGAAVYAGIRPRYGAGGATALRAGFLIWLAAYLGEMLNGLALHMLPHNIVIGECVSGLVAALVGIYVAAAIYTEN